MAGGILKQRRQDRFAQVPNSLARDKRLSLDARGLATYLLSLPADWQLRVRQLLQELGLGEDRWQRLAGQLEKAGYLARTAVPAAHGDRGSRWTWISFFDPAGDALACLLEDIESQAREADLATDPRRAAALRKAAARLAGRDSPGLEDPGPRAPGTEKPGANKEKESTNTERFQNEHTPADGGGAVSPQGAQRSVVGEEELE